MYLKPLTGFLEELGLTDIVFGKEQETAAHLKGEKIETGPDLCNAIIANFANKTSKTNFKIPAPF
jgi:hypothetical protein